MLAVAGPAGLVHALLLARAGIQVVVLEKHNDFLRDFRGDTVHPTTLRIMDELGFIDEFLHLPHTKINRVAFDSDGSIRTFGNFSALKWLGFKQPYIALMPQWDFLDFLAEKASANRPVVAVMALTSYLSRKQLAPQTGSGHILSPDQVSCPNYALLTA